MSIESLNAFSMDFFSLKGKTAIVTGGNSGLGQAFAMALAKAGANIFIPSFVKDNGETKEMIEKQGVEVDFMQVDITAEGCSVACSVWLSDASSGCEDDCAGWGCGAGNEGVSA